MLYAILLVGIFLVFYKLGMIAPEAKNPSQAEDRGVSQ